MICRIAFILCFIATASVADADTAGAEPASIATIVRQYNAQFASSPALQISSDRPADDFAPSAGTVPAWLGALDLSDTELRALVAAIGAYGSGAARSAPPTRDSSAGAVVGSMALAILADNARRRSKEARGSNTLTGDLPLATPDHRSRRRSQALATELFPARLVALDTCGGAYFAALARLNQAQPEAPFTAFARNVAEANFSGPLRADPHCGAAGN